MAKITRNHVQKPIKFVDIFTIAHIFLLVKTSSADKKPQKIKF